MSTTVLESPAVTTEAPAFPPLGLFDRCEGRGTTTAEAVKKEPSTCGAQGFIRAVASNGTSDLIFCKHHGEKLRQPLADQGFTLIDESGQINAKPSPSASEV